MLNIRPHHLFCMKAFIGKGYSEKFIYNMDNVILNLNNNKKQYIKIEAKLDNICSKCPNNINNKFCITDKEVIEMDKKIMSFFKIKEGVYMYEQIENLIYNNISEEIVEKVCKNCSWYKKTNCKELILLKSKGEFLVNGK